MVLQRVRLNFVTEQQLINMHSFLSLNDYSINQAHVEFYFHIPFYS